MACWPRRCWTTCATFVPFEDDGRLGKKIAGYHQFHAVRAAIQHRACGGGVRPRRQRTRGRWHTQGSGKSITMTRFAARVMQEPAMENPTIVSSPTATT